MINKKQKELLELIYYDLDCIDTTDFDKDNKYHLRLAKGNLKDLIKGV